MFILAWASICLRLIIPMGTMPTDGHWYLILCPDGMSVKQMPDMLGEHHQHHNSSEVEPINCDFAVLSACDELNLTASPVLLVTTYSFVTTPALSVAAHSAGTFTNYHSRAPPRVRFFYS
jgi:hypothetical protein